MSAENEVPFLSGMERQDDGPVKLVWSVDALVERARIARETLKEEADKLLSGLREAAATAAGMKSERGPDPDCEGESDFERGVRMGSMFGGYREAPKEARSTNGVIVGCTVALISTFVVSAWALSNQFSDFRGRTEEWQKAMEKRMDVSDRRLDRLENRTP